MHKRFVRTQYAFRKDFTGALAKCLVKQSPYAVPDNLEKILIDFHKRVPYDFDQNGMTLVNLATMTKTINNILESMPDVMALNKRKNGKEGWGYTSRFTGKPEPDNDFIDIMAVAQNITCEFADRADAESWLDQKKA